MVYRELIINRQKNSGSIGQPRRHIKMKHSRREFVSTGIAGVAGLYAAGSAPALAQDATALPAEDGYKLWLRYASPGAIVLQYRAALGQVLVEGSSPTSQAIRAELNEALGSMLGNAPASPATLTARALVVGTPSNSVAVRALGWQAELTKLGPE